ncbi:MAG TPA: cyclic nucleotide-binding domain-containing protein [Actinomycetota bacterium]
MGTRDIAEQLGRVPLFSGLSKRELEAVVRAGKEVSHEAGHVIAREGDRGIGFFLILDGEAKVSRGGRSLARLKAGDFFGEISLLDRGPRTATVTAATDIRLIGVTAWVFRGLLTEYPSMALKLLEVVTARLRKVMKDPLGA